MGRIARFVRSSRPSRVESYIRARRSVHPVLVTAACCFKVTLLGRGNLGKYTPASPIVNSRRLIGSNSNATMGETWKTTKCKRHSTAKKRARKDERKIQQDSLAQSIIRPRTCQPNCQHNKGFCQRIPQQRLCGCAVGRRAMRWIVSSFQLYQGMQGVRLAILRALLWRTAGRFLGAECGNAE
jgi:hypothetical protein